MRLSPAARTALDAWRASRQLTRSAAIERMILRAMVPSASPAVEAAKGRHASAHRASDPAVAEEVEPHARPRLVAVESGGDCAHTDYDVRIGGMRVCKSCGAAQGIGGVWRRG